MTSEARSERTARLLVARLDNAARAAVALGVQHEEVVRLLGSASVATMHAVALELLHPDDAAAIWASARERHPELPAHTPRRAA